MVAHDSAKYCITTSATSCLSESGHVLAWSDGHCGLSHWFIIRCLCLFALRACSLRTPGNLALTVS